MSKQTGGRDASSLDAAPGWLFGGRIPCLDGLRALAILLVICAHVEVPFGDWLPLRVVKGRCGFLGVQIFFVLSGFLITTLMLRETERTGRLSLRQFYWRRFLRIVPVYLVFLLVLGVIQACGQGNLSGRDWLGLGTYTVNFLPAPLSWEISHVWSLSVEEHFYLLWPLLMALLPPARCWKAALLCMAGALSLRWVLPLVFSDWNCPIDLWTFTRLDDIAVGCLLAFAARHEVWRGRLNWFVADGRRLALVVVGFAVSQVLFSNLLGGRLFAPVVVKLLVGLANDANALTIAVLMWAVLTRPAGFYGKALNHPVVGFVGVISYSLYLWHPLLCGPGPAWLCAFPYNLVFMFLAAVLSYTLIEKPFLSLKSRSAAAAGAALAVAPPPRRRLRPAMAAPDTRDGEREVVPVAAGGGEVLRDEPGRRKPAPNAAPRKPR